RCLNEWRDAGTEPGMTPLIVCEEQMIARFMVRVCRERAIPSHSIRTRCKKSLPSQQCTSPFERWNKTCLGFSWSLYLIRRSHMGTRLNKTLSILAVATVALGSSVAFAEDTVKLGGVISVTGGGASIGRAASIAWKLAVDEINANGGILGKKVELVIADTMTDPTHGVAEARR